jgi:hypothetical protein
MSTFFQKPSDLTTLLAFLPFAFLVAVVDCVIEAEAPLDGLSMK